MQTLLVLRTGNVSGHTPCVANGFAVLKYELSNEMNMNFLIRYFCTEVELLRVSGLHE